MKIKIAQMSDLHYSATNLEEADRCFTAAVSQAIENGVHAAIITGDSTDHAMDAHTPAIAALAKQISRLANHCPVMLLQGTFSHEPPGLLNVFQMLGAKYPITVANRIGTFGLVVGQNFETVNPVKDYDAVIHALPTLNKADIATLTSNEVGKTSEYAGEIINSVLMSWAPVNRSLRQRGIPSIVISHGTVLNCLTEHDVPMAGVDHEFGLGSLYATEADIVMLGHIHKHQSWSQDSNGFAQTVAYAGSIGRFHHGEIGDKSWLEWSLESNNSSFVARPTPSRQTIDLFFSGPPDMESIRQAAESCSGAYVRVRYEVDEEHRQNVDREAIKAALSGCAGVQIEGKTLVVERSRSKGISTAPSLEEKLAKWCSATATSESSLQDRLTLLLNTDVESIVKNVITKTHIDPKHVSAPIDSVSEIHIEQDQFAF